MTCDICTKCKSIYPHVHTNLMKGVGVKNPDILFLSDAPDKADDDSGIPFSGGANLWLKKNVLTPLNISKKDSYFTYAVKCRPTKKPKNANYRIQSTPDRRAVLQCREHVEKEIKAVKPKVIVVLGNAALCSIIYGDKITGITKWQGKYVWNKEFNCWTVFTYNPFLVMIDFSKGSSFKFNRLIDDIKLAQELAVKDPPKYKLPEKEYITSERRAIEYIKSAKIDTKIALDLETDLFDPRNEILGMSLCYKDERKNLHPAYIDWKVIEESESVSKHLSSILLSKKITKLGHNISFDRKFLHFHDFDIDGKVLDTMNMSHLLDENFSVGLKERTWIDLGFGGYEIPLDKYKFEHKFTKNTSYKKIPNEIMAPYASTDALATYMLYEKYVPRLQQEKLYPVFEKITSPVLDVMTEASITGIYADMDQARRLDKRMEVAKKKLEKKIYSIVGKQFNFMSTSQLSYLLFNQLHAPTFGKTKSGNLKCDKNVLTELAKKSTKYKYSILSQYLLKYKYLHKMQSTYIGQLNDNIWDDGRIHSNYNSGTVTGRTSNSKPCTHNIPQDRLIRSIYCASPGNLLIEADIKAAEMRAVAILSKDPILLNIVNSGLDIHKQTAREIFKIAKDKEPTDKQRNIAKKINFGLIYGITAQGLARRLGISVEEAQSYIDMYFERFQGVANWLNNTVDFAKKYGYVRSAFMRKRRLPEIKSDQKFVMYRAMRQAMNSPVQSVAADWTYIAMSRVRKEFKKQNIRSKIIHTVHDCVLVDAIPQEVKQIKKILNWAFSTQIKALPIKMVVDIEVGHRWGEKKKESNLEIILTELAA